MNLRKITALAAAGALTLGLLSACHDSEQEAQLNVNYVEFDANEAVAPYLENLPEIPEADKDFVVEMGFFDCDHMVGAIIGQESGIYEALGLNVNVTKSGQAMNALIAGDMDCAYVSFQSAINNFNKGAPLIGLVGSHLGGARYFLVRDEITSLDQIKSLTVTETSMESTEWLRFSSELGMDPDYRSYAGVSMSNSDAVTALKADQIDGCFV